MKSLIRFPYVSQFDSHILYVLDLFGGAIFIQADILRTAMRVFFVWRALTGDFVHGFFKYKVSVINKNIFRIFPEHLRNGSSNLLY